MSIKNLMEDIVYNVVNTVLKNEKGQVNEDLNVDDLVAYVLNRIPPKYITSERGMLHGKLEAKFLMQQKTDILFLIYEAIETVNKRRNTEIGTIKNIQDKGGNNFPHIVGEVLEETTFSIISDVEITLISNGKPVEMIDQSWKNPYNTSKATMGYYHFWPKFDESSMNTGNEVPFQILFSHPKFNKKEVDLKLKTVEDIDMGKSYVVPIVLFQAKDDTDLEFL